MASRTGFKRIQREDPSKRPIEERIKDFNEFENQLSEAKLQNQAERCMDCGIPYCHAFGCPVLNRIPDFNDMIYKGRWKRALEILHSTNNFPEITGRICPAPCEAACTLEIDKSPVAIKHIELQIVERGWKEGWIQPEQAAYKSSKKVAIIGSGPAGLAAAQQLARLGHEVVVFEKDDRIGGLLRYGIPDFKMEKWIIDRRMEQMKKEGVIFEVEVDAGTDISVHYMMRSFDAIVITAGATVPRTLDVPGARLNGIHFAMDFLIQQNRRQAGDKISGEEELTAKNKDVTIIGGGDTGSDCVGTARRQGAKSITQIELLPQPPENRGIYNPWPTWPNIMRTSSSHTEGCERLWSVLTKGFSGAMQVEKLNCAKLEWTMADENGMRSYKEIPGSGFTIDTGLVLLATGFLHVEHNQLVNDFDLKLDDFGNILVNTDYMTSVKGVFAGGDSVLGASLVVRAIYQGRQLAKNVDNFLSSLTS